MEVILQIMAPLMEEMADNGLKTGSRAVRRKYQHLLNRYKEIKDHNNRSGMSYALPTLPTVYMHE